MEEQKSQRAKQAELQTPGPPLTLLYNLFRSVRIHRPFPTALQLCDFQHRPNLSELQCPVLLTEPLRTGNEGMNGEVRSQNNGHKDPHGPNPRNLGPSLCMAKGIWQV